jgi:SAM-dependent methyltransferase
MRLEAASVAPCEKGRIEKEGQALKWRSGLISLPSEVEGSMSTYVFDNSWEKERERLAGLESIYDPGTMRHMDALGVGPGWSCLELGGGGGSITAWLCQRVGRSGRVVATDLDTRFLDAIDEPNLEVLCHNCVDEELPDSSFDLIHARLLFEHLPPREQVLKRLVGSLKPGGWMLIEDLDWRGLLGSPPTVINYPVEDTQRSRRVWRGIVGVMCNAGYNKQFGADLLPLFIGFGLEDVSAEARNHMVQGGSPGSAAVRWTMEQLRDRMVEGKLANRRDLDAEIEGSYDPERRRLGPTMIATWGRRPTATGMTPASESDSTASRDASERLRELPLFAGCAREELQRILNLAKEMEVGKGNELTREGDPGDTFYVILRGTAGVTRRSEKLATLGPGSFFGETALLTGGPRTATVTADTTMTVAHFRSSWF